MFFKIEVFDSIPQKFNKDVDNLMRECFGHEMDTPEKETEHRDRYCSKEDRFKHILAIEGSSVIGVVIALKRVIKFNEEKLLLGGIGGVCVKKDKRRMGVATALLRQGMAELKKANCNLAYLCADVESPGMVKFYAEVGFTPLGRPHTYLGKSGKRYADKDAMIAPVGSLEKFKTILHSKKSFDIGVGNW